MGKGDGSEGRVAKRQRGLALSVALTVLLGGLALANARLVYIAVTTAPACVPHRAIGQFDLGSTPYAAAGSSCTPP